MTNAAHPRQNTTTSDLENLAAFFLISRPPESERGKAAALPLGLIVVRPHAADPAELARNPRYPPRVVPDGILEQPALRPLATTPLAAHASLDHFPHNVGPAEAIPAHLNHLPCPSVTLFFLNCNPLY